MSQTPLYPLDYSSPTVRSGGLPGFRAAALGMAVLGMAANIGFIGLTVSGLHRARWAYRDLMRDPRAYGREVSPAIIATLRDPVDLWASQSAVILAAAFGLLLALHLLLAAAGLNRTPARSLRRLRAYSRWKGVGAAVTTVAIFWSASEHRAFWNAATRHTPVGSGPPVFSTAILLSCALLPLWWVRHGIRDGAAE